MGGTFVRSFVGCTIYLVGIIRWVLGEKYTLDWVLLLVVNVVPFGKSTTRRSVSPSLCKLCYSAAVGVEMYEHIRRMGGIVVISIMCEIVCVRDTVIWIVNL